MSSNRRLAFCGLALHEDGQLRKTGRTAEFEDRRAALLGDALGLARRTEALIDLHVATVDCRDTMNFCGNEHPRTLAEFREKVLPREGAFKRAMIIASIYLDDAQNEIMKNTLGAFKQASMAIWLNLPDEECPAKKESYYFETRQLDWKRFFEASDAAIGCLKGILNPEILDRLGRAR